MHSWDLFLAVEIPNHKVPVADGAFHGCTMVAKLTIPDSVTHKWTSCLQGLQFLDALDHVEFNDPPSRIVVLWTT